MKELKNKWKRKRRNKIPSSLRMCWMKWKRRKNILRKKRKYKSYSIKIKNLTKSGKEADIK
jgi:hypothetical protein